MNSASMAAVGEIAWNSAVASASPVNVPARRGTARLKGVGETGLGTKAEGVAEGGGIQREVGAQHGENAGQAQAPGVRGFAAVELPGAGLADVCGEFHGGGELPSERVELVAGLGARGGQLGGGAGGMGRAQPLGESVEFAQALFMRVALDAGSERGADGVQHAGGEFAGAVEEGAIVGGAGLATDADVQAAEGQQREANAFRIGREP